MDEHAAEQGVWATSRERSGGRNPRGQKIAEGRLLSGWHRHEPTTSYGSIIIRLIRSTGHGGALLRIRLIAVEWSLDCLHGCQRPGMSRLKHSPLVRALNSPQLITVGGRWRP